MKNCYFTSKLSLDVNFRYGGIYLDDTQIVTRSMDPLRTLSCSMPYEKKGTLMNGVIVAEPNAPFLKKWLFLGYQDFEVRFQRILRDPVPHTNHRAIMGLFQDNRWAWNSCRKPYFLWEKYPDLLHVEPRTFLPSWDQWEVRTEKLVYEKTGYFFKKSLFSA